MEASLKINSNFIVLQSNNYSNYFNLSFLTKYKYIYKSNNRTSKGEEIIFKNPYIRNDEENNSIIVEPIQDSMLRYLSSLSLGKMTKYFVKSGRNYSLLNYKYADTDCNGEIDLKDIYKMRQNIISMTSYDPCFS